MIITILSCFDDLMRKDTGASVRIYQLAKNLASLGHRVRIIIPGTNKVLDWTTGVRVYTLNGLYPLRFLSFLCRMLGILRPSSLLFYDLLFVYKTMRMTSKSDIIQIEQPWSAGLVIPFLVKILKKSLVIDCHDVFQALRIKRGFLRSALEVFVEKLAYKIADLILVVSDDDEDLLCRHRIGGKKVKIITNGVDTDAFSPRSSAADIIDRFNLEGFHRVVFVGNMEYLPNKEAARVIVKHIAPKVLSEISNVKFLLVGRFSERIIAQMENVIFTGVVEDVPSFLTVSDVAIAPLFHGSGTRLKVLEYFSCGLPVVSTKIGAEGLEVRNGENILIVDDTDAFSSKVIELLKNRDYSTKIGRAARNLVVNDYDWRKIVGKLDEFYMDLFLSKD